MTATARAGAGADARTASTVSVLPVGVGFTPFENLLDVIDRVAAHAELREASDYPPQQRVRDHCGWTAGRRHQRDRYVEAVASSPHATLKLQVLDVKRMCSELIFARRE